VGAKVGGVFNAPEFYQLTKPNNSSILYRNLKGSNIMEHAIIHLWRKPPYTDLLRAYKIIIDGKRVGTIRPGKRHLFEIEPGHHDIFLRVDWGSSRHLSIDLAPGEEVKLICQGGNPFAWLYNVTAGARNYIKLYYEA